MIVADLPANEQERLRRLKELDILDTVEEQAYDDLTTLAAQICDAPIALISLLDENRQWFKSHRGLNIRETPREIALCSHAILNDGVFIVEDANQDERFHDNPLVKNELGLKFYAGAPLILDDNIRIGTICVIDQHKRKLTDDQITALEALARQVISQLQLRLKIKELKDLDHAKDEFLSMVSHELRTPLTSLKGSLNIMHHLDGNSKEQMQPLMDVAVRNADQLLVIVNDILDLAQMEAGSLDITLTPINVSTLLHLALELNEFYIKQCGCTVTLEIPDSANDVLVIGDEPRLIQVITNLLSNAAKFSPRGGTINVSLQTKKDSVQISVTDTGVGIPDEYQQHVFTKFRQLGINQNQKLPGTGLGLNICKHIIEAHEGEVGFESVPNVKTAFYFTLKRAD